MTQIKFCGLSRLCDIDFANELKPEFIRFVFVHQSKRYILPEHAIKLKARLSHEIQSVGVFMNENLDVVANIASQNIFDMIQLHGSEDDNYVRHLKYLTGKVIIKAFVIKSAQDIIQASGSSADYVLLDGGGGTGKAFDWDMIKDFRRDYFLAGGLTPENVKDAINILNPFAVDTSSGIENNQGFKDEIKMAEFIDAVRGG